MKVLTRDQLIAKLEKAYPEMNCMLTEDFDGSKGGIWLSGEDGLTDKTGKELFKYYSQDSSGKSYIMGVRIHLHNFLKRNGWYGAWNDPGTIMLWEF